MCEHHNSLDGYSSSNGLRMDLERIYEGILVTVSNLFYSANLAMESSVRLISPNGMLPFNFRINLQNLQATPVAIVFLLAGTTAALLLPAFDLVGRFRPRTRILYDINEHVISGKVLLNGIHCFTRVFGSTRYVFLVPAFVVQEAGCSLRLRKRLSAIIERVNSPEMNSR